jgi:hypothetical protein
MTETTDPGIRQCTSYEYDERYYQRWLDQDTVIYAPSLTHVLGECYPGNDQLSRWRGDVGNERADVLLREGSEIGNYVHAAAPRLFAGESIPSQEIRDLFFPGFRSLKVLRCLAAFCAWVEEWQVEPVKDAYGNPRIEFVTWCEVAPGLRFAGTVDLLVWATAPKKERMLYLVDLKTGTSIHESNKAQVCGYRYSIIQNEPNLPPPIPVLLHLGNTTKKHWSFNPLDGDDVRTYEDRCLAAVAMWSLHHPDAQPNAEQFPETFTLKQEGPC